MRLQTRIPVKYKNTGIQHFLIDRNVMYIMYYIFDLFIKNSVVKIQETMSDWCNTYAFHSLKVNSIIDNSDDTSLGSTVGHRYTSQLTI